MVPLCIFRLQLLLKGLAMLLKIKTNPEEKSTAPKPFQLLSYSFFIEIDFT